MPKSEPNPSPAKPASPEDRAGAPRTMEEQLRQQAALITRLAHDLNNILAPILMTAPLLRAELPLAEREKIVGMIEASAQRGVGLVRQMYAVKAAHPPAA